MLEKKPDLSSNSMYQRTNRSNVIRMVLDLRSLVCALVLTCRNSDLLSTCWWSCCTRQRIARSIAQVVL